MKWIQGSALAIVLVAACSTLAAAEQREALLGLSMDFDNRHLTLEVASTGCTKKEDFRFEYKGGVLTVFRKERDACKAVPWKIRLAFSFKEVGIDPYKAFTVSNPFVANERLADLQ